MNDTFYQFFVRDEESPEYTACMALIIFNELKRIHLIDADDADDKDCRRIADFKIPERYKHDTQNDGATEHCWYLSYKYGYSGHVPPCREDEFYIRKVCSLGICKNQYD
ncbi:MAG: hypothetical protein LBI03_06570 [Clostridiales bacterium]|nr:hypothetical protein [Clostridiales bacterium]